MPDAIPPTTPADLTAITQYLVSPQVNLAWTASTDSGGSGLAGYQIEVDQGFGFVFIGTTAVITYAASGLLTGKVSTFRVRAYDNNNNFSGWSATATATTLRVIDGYDSPEATEELLPDSAGLGGFYSPEATEELLPYSTSSNPCPPANVSVLYRMRAYDASLARHVYWNYDSIDSIGAGYAGPGPISDVVAFAVLGQPFLLIVPGTGFEAMPEQWVKLNVPASQALTAMSAQVSTNFDTIKMLRAGSIVGLATRLTEAITAGTLTVSVTINGAPGLTIVHSTGSTGSTSTQVTGIDNYVAGDLVGISYSTGAGFLPTTTDLEAWLQVVEVP